MSKKHLTPMPNLVAETFMSTLKIFTVILVIIVVFNNLVWIYSVSNSKPVGDAHVEINQTGNRDIVQEINR